MRLLFRLWIVASVCWVATAYWALKGQVSQGLPTPLPWAFILGVPAGILALMLALRWVTSARR